MCLRIKGDGKKYQFRIKRKKTDLIHMSGIFQTTSIGKHYDSNKEMYPAFRGRHLQIGEFKTECNMKQLLS